jgi:SpoVK/Ycf46/Vps4 family AAA+-type ATPase
VSQDAGRELALLIRAGWRVIVLETFEEARALRLLEQVSRVCKRRLVVWSEASGLDRSGRGAGPLEAGLLVLAEIEEAAVIAVLDAQRVVHEQLATRRLRDALQVLGERSQTLVLIGPIVDVPVELEREVSYVELPLPRRADLDALFQAQMKDADPELLQSAASAALGLTAAEASRVLRKACLAAGALGPSAIEEMVREKRQALRRTPALEFCDAAPHLGEVGGLSELKRWLRERRRAFSPEAAEFRLPPPRGLLLLGVQGCGKSLCAKAVAREWQFPLLRLDLAEAFGRSDASPEAACRTATAVAESLAPAVLWIDEIEKGFAAAGSDASSGRVFGAFLTWLAEKTAPVFVVATANDITLLPPELLRRGRFDDLFFVDLPNQRERMEILTIHLRKHGRDPASLPLEDLAKETERFSGAELEQVVAAGLYRAFADGRELEDRDLHNAITDTIPLYETYEKTIKELRDWARTRARAASADTRLAALFT